ncbi:hypothetical protein U9R90_31135 [Streptomyces sp. E11-3]
MNALVTSQLKPTETPAQRTGARPDGGELPDAGVGSDDHVVADDRVRVDVRGGVDAVGEVGDRLAVEFVPGGRDVGQLVGSQLAVRGVGQVVVGAGGKVVAPWSHYGAGGCTC